MITITLHSFYSKHEVDVVIKNIISIESSRDRTFIYLKGRRAIEVAETIGQIRTLLTSIKGYERIIV